MSEEFKLFIGGLSLNTDNDSLTDYFKPFGKITDCVVMRDSNHPQRKSRGFGFVTFDDKSSYDDCLSKKEHEIDGRVVEVKRAVPKNELGSSSVSRSNRVKKVFLGGMSPETRSEDIKEALEKYCGEGTVAEVQIMTDKHTNKPRGFGFALFKGEEDAYETVDNLVRNKFIKIGDRDVEVKPAKSLEEMRKEEEGRGSSRPFYPSNPNSSYSYGSARDTYPPRNMYDSVRGMPSNYYGGTPYDYVQPRSGREYPTSGYPSMQYDRTGANTYGYDSTTPSSYQYGKYYSGMMGSYPQSASSYGPVARSYGDYKERSDRGDLRASYHPYGRR